MITFWGPFTTLNKVRNFVYQPYVRTPNLHKIHKLILKEIVNLHVLSGLQYSSVTQSYLTLCNLMDCSMPGFPVRHQLPELAQTHVHRVGDTIQPSHPLLPPSPPAFNLSQHQGFFQWVSSLHQVAKYWSFSISPSSESSGLISFRIDWIDLLAVQGTLKMILHSAQFESINSSMLSLL